MTAHDFEFTSIDGAALPLSTWQDKAVLLANTATLCEFTPQYEGFQEIWERYRERGLGRHTGRVSRSCCGGP